MTETLTPGRNKTPCRVYLVTSAKGGVGKTSVAAGLAATFAARGLRTLAIDLDLTNRCLDLICGVEDRVTFHILDILNGTDPERAIFRDTRCENLFYLTAPSGMSLSEEDAAALVRFLKELRTGGAYDVIVIDTPGSVDRTLHCAASAADCALVVSTEQQTAIRAAEMTANLLDADGVPEQRLLVNCFESGRGHREKLEKWTCLVRYIDTTSLRLCGVIPFEHKLWRLQNEGKLLTDRAFAGTALPRIFANVADRLCGHDVPIRF